MVPVTISGFRKSESGAGLNDKFWNNHDSICAAAIFDDAIDQLTILRGILPRSDVYQNYRSSAVREFPVMS